MLGVSTRSSWTDRATGMRKKNPFATCWTGGLRSAAASTCNAGLPDGACLHPGARMLVVFEHQTLLGEGRKRTCIDFDDREATAARIQMDLRPDIYYYDSWTWEGLWPDLLAKWYGDEMLRSSVTEDAIWELMWFDDVSDEALDHERDLEALAGLLNIVRPRDLGLRCMLDKDPDISTDDFMAAYTPFSGWRSRTIGNGLLAGLVWLSIWRAHPSTSRVW